MINEWENWKANLYVLQNLQFDRSVKPPCNFDFIVEISLRYFSDASEIRHVQCSYTRLVIRDRKIHCCLQIGKLRVLPVKYASMQRMELTEAVLSVKVASQLKRELSLRINKEIF